MKLATGLFWGIILILIGLSIVIRIVFNIDLPVFKLLVAFFFIWLGMRIMMGHNENSRQRDYKNDVIFNENYFKGAGIENKEYNVVFGKGVYDFRDIDLKESVKIKLSTVFGGAEIKLKKGTPYKIVTEAVFGGIRLPNDNTSVFGKSHFQSDNFNQAFPHLYIKAEVVFGGIELREY